jgi:REP element-mobilizing transposase RayT
MSRQPRASIAGGIYHVIQRGNNRQAIFFSDADRRAFLNRLQRCAEECACLVHGYCLMTNHLHLLIQTSRPNVSAFSQRLFGGHTLWANRHHHRVGHLFQGRFTSALVAEDPYMQQVSRYIHLNPVKARMVARPEDYPWSSMRAYLPTARGPKWLHTEATLEYFAGSRARYVAFVYEGIGQADPEIVVERQDGANKQRTASLIRQQEQAPTVEGTAQQILEAVERSYGLPAQWLERQYTRQPQVILAKAEAAGLLRHRTSLTLREIGQELGGISAPAVAKHLRAARRSSPVNTVNA